jgi:uncharacterized protein YegL
VSAPSTYRQLRRLPVFFLLDTSKAMAGIFEVTVQQGLHVVKNKLYEHPGCQYAVHLSSITFGSMQMSQTLASLGAFEPGVSGWQARGECVLRAALLSLVEALSYDLISPSSARLGDYKPLVFLVLGSRPTDSWQDVCALLQALPGHQQPLIVALVTHSVLAREVKALSPHVLLLKPTEGECMTNFFLWVAQTIITVCESCERGDTAIRFPELPYGVVTAA